MSFLSPNQQCQSTEGKNITSRGLAYPELAWGLPTLSLTTNSSWLPWGRVAMPLISPLMPVPLPLGLLIIISITIIALALPCTAVEWCEICYCYTQTSAARPAHFPPFHISASQHGSVWTGFIPRRCRRLEGRLGWQPVISYVAYSSRCCNRFNIY